MTLSSKSPIEETGSVVVSSLLQQSVLKCDVLIHVVCDVNTPGQGKTGVASGRWCAGRNAVIVVALAGLLDSEAKVSAREGEIMATACGHIMPMPTLLVP